MVSNESNMTPEQYERLVRFTEDASMEEKQEILCKLEHSGDLTLDEQTLKEIMKIKDAVEKETKNMGCFRLDRLYFISVWQNGL